MKKFLFLVVLLLSTLLLAKPSRVAYVINGSLGDQSFYDSGYAGIKKLEEDFKVQTRVIECNFDPSLYYPSLVTAAHNGRM